MDAFDLMLPRVVVIADEPDLAELIRNVLENEGHQVILARSIAEGGKLPPASQA